MAADSPRPLPPALVFGPVVAVVSCSALLALAAAALGFHRQEMLLIAGVAGSLVALAALVLIYRQVAERNAAHQRLADVQARVGGIVESAMDAIITVDEEQRVVQFNAAAERVFRWPRTAVLGQPLDMLIPTRFHEAHRGHVERFGRTATTSRGMGAQMVLHGLRADGGEFPIEASISQLAEGGRKLFTVILRDVTERVAAESERRRSREEIHDLALAAQNLREQEKRRVARELHDELGQALTALKIDVAWMRSRLADADAELAHKLSSMQLLLDGTVAATRRISADLRPLVLDDLGLAAAADWLVQNFSMRTGIPCELVVSRGLELDDPHATTVFRVLQESLTNIAKHADASKVEVSLDRTGRDVTLVVNDDGKGFSLEAPRKPASYGLLGLRERAKLLGGELSIESAPGRGTTIEMRLPVEETMAAR